MKKSQKVLAIINLVVLLALIFWNYRVNAIGINGNTVGSLSREYENLFTPASYAFSIWGLIFLSLTAQAIYLVKSAFSKGESQFIPQMGPFLILANLLNGAWLWFWLTEQTGWSVVIMLGILASLVLVILRLNMERWHAPRFIIGWIWWPICLYSGWIAVATIANFSAYLAKVGWTGGLDELTWTIIMILVATGLNLWMIYARSMREFALVGVWALVAIALRHWGEIPSLQFSALAGAGLIFLYSSYHGFKNRKSNPFNPRNFI